MRELQDAHIKGHAEDEGLQGTKISPEISRQAKETKEFMEKDMNNMRGKRSSFRLLAFIVITTGLFFLCIQLSELFHRYSNKDKKISYHVSEEDAPIPVLFVCTFVDQSTRADVLQKYNLERLYLEDIWGDFIYLEEVWKDFPWEEVDLKQVFEEAVMFPAGLVDSCTIGENYTCTDIEGPSHKWVNDLMRKQSCSMLQTTLKVPYGQSTSVRVEFNPTIFSGYPSLYRQFEFKGIPQYYLKYLYTLPVAKEDFHYVEEIKVVKHRFVSDEERLCSEDDNFIQCEEDCMEAHLMKGNFSCVLPWMKSPGPRCKSIAEVDIMTKRERLTDTLECDCIPPCEYYQFSSVDLHKSISDFNYHTLLTTLIIDNNKGIISFHEDYLYYFLDLLANCGGCISVFGTFSMLWLIERILEAMLNITETKVLQLFKTWEKARIQKYLMWLATAVCYSLFLYQAVMIVIAFVKNSVILKVDRANPEEAPLPVVLICNDEVDMDYLTEVANNPGYKLGKNYFKRFYKNPRSIMSECLVSDESCMENSGTYFFWETKYYTQATCAIFHIRKSLNATLRQFSATFDTDGILASLYVTLMDETKIPRYDLLRATAPHYVGNHYRGTFSYDMEVHHAMPPCTDTHFKCRDTCWETEFIKQDLCTPPYMPMSVKNQPCGTLGQLVELEHFIRNLFFNDECSCLPPCSEIHLKSKAGAIGDLSSFSKTKVQVSLVPRSYTKFSEDIGITANTFVSEIGGILGLLTGTSFLEIAIIVFFTVVNLNKKVSIRFSVITSVGKVSLYCIAYGFFSYRVFVILTEYAKNAVHVIQGVDSDQKLVLPDFAVCMIPRRFELIQDGVVLGLVSEGNSFRVDTYGDIFSYWESDYQFNTYLGTCYVFGMNCRDKSGELYEWRPMPDVNGYCWKLHVYPVNANDLLRNTIELTYISLGFRVYLLNEQETISEIQHITGDYITVKGVVTMSYDLFGSRYELLEEQPGGCIHAMNYTQNKCLTECLNEHLVKTYGCHFPWMKDATNLTVCRNPDDYLYTAHLNTSLMDQCNCPLPCRYDKFTTELQLIDDEAINFSTVKFITHDIITLTREVWEYTASKLFAELGGLMSLLTGLTLYGIVFSGFNMFTGANHN